MQAGQPRRVYVQRGKLSPRVRGHWQSSQSFKAIKFAVTDAACSIGISWIDTPSLSVRALLCSAFHILINAHLSPRNPLRERPRRPLPRVSSGDHHPLQPRTLLFRAFP